jgi:hypothetical protein
MKMTKAQQSERDEYIAKLRETLKPGDTLHTVLRHVSRSGMSRVIDVYHFHTLADGRVAKDWLSYWISKACDFQFSKGGCGKPEGIKIGGCGMDMGFAIVYDVGRVLWPQGFECAGERCPSNDHSNGDRNYKPHMHTCDGGYALHQEWL